MGCPAQLEGSNTVRSVNDRFVATMTNVVHWEEAAPAAAGKQICSDTSIQARPRPPRLAAAAQFARWSQRDEPGTLL